MGVGMAGVVTLFLAETPGGAGITVTLAGSLFNVGAAGGGALGGLLLAVGGYDGVAIGLPRFGLAAAFLNWRPTSGEG